MTPIPSDIHVPVTLQLLFFSSVLLTLAFLFRAGLNAKGLLLLLAWGALQSALGSTGFYENTRGLPPRAILMIAPPMIFLLALMFSAKGRELMRGFDLRWLTLLHVVRLVDEYVLRELYLHGYVPQMMTWEGLNWDIISGITAPMAAIFLASPEKLRRIPLLIWNIVCLALLLNVVVRGVLSVPSELQQLNFEAPNTAMLFFPFCLLPSVVVPVVMFSHISSLIQLFNVNGNK